MTSQKLSIAIAFTFLVGVAAWYGAMIWTFGNFRTSSVVAFVLAIVLAVSLVRGDMFSRWLTVLLSASGAYASFNLYSDLNAKGIDGAAYLFPGSIFSVCAVVLFAFLVAGYLQKRQTKE